MPSDRKPGGSVGSTVMHSRLVMLMGSDIRISFGMSVTAGWVVAVGDCLDGVAVAVLFRCNEGVNEGSKVGEGNIVEDVE